MRSQLAVSVLLFLSCVRAFAPGIDHQRQHLVSPHSLRNGASITSLRMTNVKTGKVKWFDPRRGFGFIALDDGSGDVYIHQTNIRMEGFRKLVADEQVRFRTDVDQKRGKTFAHDVVRIGSEEDIHMLESAAADAEEAEVEATIVAEGAEKAAEEIAAELATQAEEEAAEARGLEEAEKIAADAIMAKLKEENAASEADKVEEEKVAAVTAEKEADDPLSKLKSFFHL